MVTGLTKGLVSVELIGVQMTPLIVVAGVVIGGVAVGFPPIWTDSPIQTILSGPASAIGLRRTFTSINTCLVSTQPLIVAVKVYVISKGGLATGCATVLLFKNKFGVQRKVAPGET